MSLQNETGAGSDLAGTMSRIQKARELAESLAREKSRITGELGALQNQLKDLETKCKTDFDCTIGDLPEFISQLKTEAETALSNAEIILGLKQGTVQKPVSQTVDAPVVPKAKPAQKVKPFVEVRDGVDSDGILG